MSVSGDKIMTTSSATKNRLFEDRHIPTESGELLHAKLMMPKPPISPRRVVLISPLVGASAAQPLLIFRNFTRRGSIMISFEYRGHAESTGTFELDNTVTDVHHALIWARDYAAGLGLPLHAFATCYGTIPLLAQFKEHGQGRVFRSLNMVSGLFRLDQILRFDDFASVLGRNLGRPMTRTEFLAALLEQRIDWNGDPFRNSLREYLTGLFPELRIGRDFFEEIQYDRVRIPETLHQLSQARYLDGVSIPPEIPCNVFFGRNDDTLGTQTVEGRDAYRDRVLSLIPHAVLHEREFDHFGRGLEHDAVIEHLSDIFEQHDSSPIPAPHIDELARIRRIPR
jgi:hypothetical protein